jgi:hypothetical protein
MLKKNGFQSVKETVKPGFIEAMKEARLVFCKAYKHWTLEDWKKIIWTDETSVILGHCCGKYRVWRQRYERHMKTVICSQFKRASEFMFWGAFSWDYKSPFHIWTKETAKQKKAAQKEIDDYNGKHEMNAQIEWELETAMRRLNMNYNPGGHKPK